jgi:phosphotransferase system enzyme I (PtsP)
LKPEAQAKAHLSPRWRFGLVSEESSQKTMHPGGTTYEGSLLLTLEEISQLVSHSHDPAETLANTVRLVQGRFHTAVCSVYLYDPATRELVLSATVGLQEGAVGKVRMRLDEGLTGLVGEQMAPVMVADAFAHPRFKYFPEAGEDPYHSFLGVPLVESGELQGVLVVQTQEPRNFTPSEVRMLVTVAAQIASLVSDARLLEQVQAVTHGTAPTAPAPAARAALRGVGISPGRGVGAAYILVDAERWRQSVPLSSNDPDRERQRLIQAVMAARSELVHLSQRISELVGEDHGAILQAQLMIMQDRTIEADLEACLKAGHSAEGALLTTLDRYVAAFQKLATQHLQERVYDIKDVFHRILWQLQPRQALDPAGGKVVLVAREASVMELFAVDLDRLAGVVVEHGGPQSHAAILARSLGIPMVAQVANFGSLLEPGRTLLADGSQGLVIPDPDPALVAGCVRPAGERAAPGAPAAPQMPGLPRLEVNVNLQTEVGPALAMGAAGVGLYRSEFLFLARRTLPTEEEQVGIYRKLVHLLAGRPVTIRTFDLRPDKLATMTHLGPAARSLDWRLALESPALQQLFLDQVRAILRVAIEGPVRLLIPLVTRTELLRFVQKTLAEARAGLEREGLAFAREVDLGIMIEVAAAVPLVRAWAEDVAFFALGTNDLTASALDVDRDDPVAAGLADPLHPGLLHLIDQVVTPAHDAGRPVTVCGEMAADPLGSLALCALGVDSISVPVSQFPAMRQFLGQLRPERLPGLRTELLAQHTADEVRRVLQAWHGSPAPRA